jgi:nitroreductase
MSERWDAPMSGPEHMTALEMLTTTRAVRRRLDLDRAVPRDLIRRCIEIATQAPSGRNLQRWRWVVVDDAQHRAQLADLWRAGYGQPRAETFEPGGMKRIMTSTDHLSTVLDRVPMMVVPCLLDRPPRDGTAQELSDFYGSGLPAVWSFMLAARTFGLGTAFTTVHLAREKEAAELLGIPDTVTQLCLLPVAFTKGAILKPAERRPVDEIMYWNAWRNHGSTS